MPVIFHVPGPLRSFTDGRAAVAIETSPATVRDALETLSMLYPGIRDRLFTEQGQIREHINVFLGNENIRDLEGLGTPASADAEITIVPAISGGAAGRP